MNNNNKAPYTLSERRKEYIHKLIGKVFKASTGEEYVEGKLFTRSYPKRTEAYDMYFITFTNYNQLKLLPSKWIDENDPELNENEKKYLTQVCNSGNNLIMVHFNNQTGYSPTMFMVYYCLWTFADSDPQTNISVSLFPKGKDGQPNEMKIIVDNVIDTYLKMKAGVDIEINKNFPNKSDRMIDEYPIFSDPYIYFVYPEIYSKMAVNMENEFWKNAQTEEIGKCQHLQYLKEMGVLYKQAYRVQQEHNKIIEEYVKKHGLSKEELEKIANKK